MARRDLDAYDTPDALADAIVWRALTCAVQSRIIFEPTAGGGVFVRVARRLCPAAWIAAVDIDPERLAGLEGAGANAAATSDVCTVPPAMIGKTDLIIGNPPYRDAEKILLHLLGAKREDAACFMLLPVGFLASKGRHGPEGIFTRFPLRYLAPIAPRPSFTADGKTDRMEYALFGWGAALPKGIDSAILWEKSK